MSSYSAFIYYLLCRHMEHQLVSLSRIGLAWYSETHAHPENLSGQSVGLSKRLLALVALDVILIGL